MCPWPDKPGQWHGFSLWPFNSLLNVPPMDVLKASHESIGVTTVLVAELNNVVCNFVT